MIATISRPPTTHDVEALDDVPGRPATGWIIPLAATIRLEVRDDGKHVEAGWEFDRTMVSNHSGFQVAGNPYEPRPPMKIHNYWTVRTAPGWSCLFVPALNRPNGVIDVLSGVVDTDAFATPVNFPFVVTAGDGVHVLPKGTPLVQVIPFRRTRRRSAGWCAPSPTGNRPSASGRTGASRPGRLVPPPRPRHTLNRLDRTFDQHVRVARVSLIYFGGRDGTYARGRVRGKGGLSGRRVARRQGRGAATAAPVPRRLRSSIGPLTRPILRRRPPVDLVGRRSAAPGSGLSSRTSSF